MVVILYYATTKNDKPHTPVNNLCLCGATAQHIVLCEPQNCLTLCTSLSWVISHNSEVTLDKAKWHYLSFPKCNPTHNWTKYDVSVEVNRVSML